ncbi:MAG TPA: hypothetical protein VM848_08360 [Acidimicrobiia bacterium]|nr:hypothetical protein [Acidimicrobiia bacterium]
MRVLHRYESTIIRHNGNGESNPGLRLDTSHDEVCVIGNIGKEGV